MNRECLDPRRYFSRFARWAIREFLADAKAAINQAKSLPGARMDEKGCRQEVFIMLACLMFLQCTVFPSQLLVPFLKTVFDGFWRLSGKSVNPSISAVQPQGGLRRLCMPCSVISSMCNMTRPGHVLERNGCCLQQAHTKVGSKGSQLMVILGIYRTTIARQKRALRISS